MWVRVEDMVRQQGWTNSPLPQFLSNGFPLRHPGQSAPNQVKGLGFSVHLHDFLNVVTIDALPKRPSHHSTAASQLWSVATRKRQDKGRGLHLGLRANFSFSLGLSFLNSTIMEWVQWCYISFFLILIYRLSHGLSAMDELWSLTPPPPRKDSAQMRACTLAPTDVSS